MYISRYLKVTVKELGNKRSLVHNLAKQIVLFLKTELCNWGNSPTSLVPEPSLSRGKCFQYVRNEANLPLRGEKSAGRKSKGQWGRH